ncbi:uncharacterized mitochondrial protein AtMg00810-like [Carya illinoinensis]|uniref:uncharacterized mitochondrial protein AtMg00810-like n=1 Tax=Carya illinoinensis TaxID=32201 RepID=UPI001C726AB9|nr:uncharacterized mitochondrial protein AtMg00810-like [Carya illinoinensis]
MKATGSSSSTGLHIPYPLSSVLSYTSLSPSFKAFTTSISIHTEPTSHIQALKDPIWREAMEQELTALENNETWSIVELTHGKKLIDCKWIYRYKFKADGSNKRAKARLVARGFTQREVSIHTLLIDAAIKGWDLQQLDINNEFLYGDLDEELYMRLPPDLASSKSNQSDDSLFIKHTVSSFTALLVYVDYIIVMSSNNTSTDEVKQFLSTKFKIKNLGSLKYFLGMEIARSKVGIQLCQRKYTLDILSETGLLAAKPSPLPMEPNLKLQKDQGDVFHDPTLYRKLVGKLLYLTNTRPDLSYSVNLLSQFMEIPRVPHYNALLKVLRYLKGNLGQGLFFSTTSSLKLTTYSDANCANCPDIRRSTTGFCVFIDKSLVAWKPKKQHTVS